MTTWRKTQQNTDLLKYIRDSCQDQPEHNFRARAALTLVNRIETLLPKSHCECLAFGDSDMEKTLEPTYDVDKLRRILFPVCPLVRFGTDERHGSVPFNGTSDLELPFACWSEIPKEP